jgi:hypothetical protein
MPADPRNVDKKVPTWDGDPDKWESFRDAVRWHFRKRHERERVSVAAHVAGNVTGKAWEHINRLSEQDQDILADRGLDAVIDFFKDGLLENQIPEAGKHFREYVYKFRREKGESMKLYTARHTYQLGKLEKAMAGLKSSTPSMQPIPTRRMWPAAWARPCCAWTACRRPSTKSPSMSGARAGSSGGGGDGCKAGHSVAPQYHPASRSARA